MNIVFDLDGTLIDSKLRLYKLFQYLAPSSTFTYEQYWFLKQNKISNEHLLSTYLGYDKESIECFISKWMSLIESSDYLQLDTNFEGMHNYLEALTDIADLFVCTARQLRQPVIDQLASFRLLPYFKKVMVTEQRDSKKNLIVSHISNLSSKDWMVGDTGKDIQVGKSLNMKTCAVLSGFLNFESLKTYEPNLIVDSVFEFNV